MIEKLISLFIGRSVIDTDKNDHSFYVNLKDGESFDVYDPWRDEERILNGEVDESYFN